MKHNKKRNIGLMYELLLHHLSGCLVTGDSRGAKVTTKILEKRFAKGTMLYREFRLFNALAQSTVSDTHIVASILSEAKNAARKINVQDLSREKSLLIRDINYKLNNESFYHQRIKNYKDLATIQITINEWRKEDDADLKKLIELEQKVGSQLLKEKKVSNIQDEKEKLDASGTDKLVLRIMTEKINKKYSCLSPDEREIIKNYVFYSQQDKDYLKEYLIKKQKHVLTILESFEENEKNKILLEKVDNVRKSINSIDANDINDKSIVKFLTVAKLINELEKKEI